MMSEWNDDRILGDYTNNRDTTADDLSAVFVIEWR